MGFSAAGGWPPGAFADAARGTVAATIQCPSPGATEAHYRTQWIPND